MKDSTWIMFNKRLIEAMENNNWSTISIIYYEMAERVESEAKDANYLRVQGYNARLRYLNGYLDNRMLEEVMVCALENACTYCKELSGTVIPAEDARHLSPIPCKECTGEQGCRCTYMPTDSDINLRFGIIGL